MEYAVKSEFLVKKFKEKEILREISVSVKKGSIYGLIGANGSGKTTFMKLMLGLLKPTGGKLEVLGKNVADSDKSYLARTGSLIETPVFYRNMNVRENLSLHCSYLGETYKKDIPAILKRVGLGGCEEMRISELSLGMKQRLAIGRAMLCRPELMILDEPINGIDPQGIVEIRNLLKQVNKEEGMTIIISSHIINEMEKLADTIGIISHGKLLEEIDRKTFAVNGYSLEGHFLNLLNSNNVQEPVAV